MCVLLKHYTTNHSKVISYLRLVVSLIFFFCFLFHFKFFQLFREWFPRVYFLMQGEAVCAGHEKVEVNPLVTFFVPGGGHTLFRRMQTAWLMDCQSVCFPGFIFIREIVTQPLGEAEERAGLLFCSGLHSPGSRMR